MNPIRTHRPQEPAAAEVFWIADEVALEYFQRRCRDPNCNLHATGWQFATNERAEGALLDAVTAGALTQEQMRSQIQDYLRKAPLEVKA